MSATKRCQGFIDSLEYLDAKLLKYFELMSSMQKEAYNELLKDKNVKFFLLENLDAHVKVCNFLATKWSSAELKDVYQKVTEMYLYKLYPPSLNLPMEYKSKVANYGRYLTAIAFVNGDYYLGLTFAITVLDLVPLDSYMFALMSRWCCKLHEFEIFHKYDNLDVKYSFELNDMRKICRLSSEFYKSSETEKQIEIVDKMVVIKDKLINANDKTYFGFMCLSMAFNLLGHASKLPTFDVEKYGDMTGHFNSELRYTQNILHCRQKTFKKYGAPLFIYDYQELPDSQNFLKTVSAIPDFFDTEIMNAKLMIDTGCLDECEGMLIHAVYCGLLSAVPFRVIQPLNMLYLLKFRTVNDQEKLKAFGAMIALLLGKVSDQRRSTIYSRFRADLLADSYIFQTKAESESVLNKTLVTFVAAIPKHLLNCDCFLCYEISMNGNLCAERQYSDLLIDSISVTSCEEFYLKMRSTALSNFKSSKAKLYSVALNIDIDEDKELKRAPLSLLTYICEASTQTLLVNSNIGAVSRTKLCGNILKCSAYFKLVLRYYFLIGRQFSRKCYSMESYSWLYTVPTDNESPNSQLDKMFKTFDAFGISKNGRQSPPKSPSREVLASRTDVYKKEGKKGIGIGGMTEAETEDLHQARAEFKLYQHLFFSEWRRRICHYLGSYLSEAYPWYAAWYFIESRSISLRQYVRTRNDKIEDMRFKDINEFKNAVRALPNDFSLVQLIVDEQNVLWLVRCGYDLIPIVLPLTKIDVGKDKISHQMYNLLIANDQSVEGNRDNGQKFWQTRREINEKLERLINDVECNWLEQFRVLLMPFGPFDEKLLPKLDKLSNILQNVGFSKERGKFLSRLFLHAFQDDFKYLLSIFSFIERETFKNPVNFETQNEIYRKLSKECPENLYQSYLKEDRFTVFIVSPELSCYPWECLPVCKANPFILRTQSFHFFDRLMKKSAGPLPLTAKSHHACYVLNPGGDLANTEKRIEKNFDLDKLAGHKGNYPSIEKFKEMLEKNDFYLFIGHGSGSKYFGHSTVQRSMCKAVAILMGCSSVRIEDHGRGFDGKSAVNDFAIAGSPCTIGCLWMVTDGEIDKFLIDFTERCFTEWSRKAPESSVYKTPALKGVKSNYPYRLLIKAVVQARQACRLKTLTGGAVVVYGIPVFNDVSCLESLKKLDDSDVIIIDD